MKKIFSFIAGCLFTVAASADTANPVPFTIVQPDGTTLTLRLVGDEHFHYYVDLNSGREMLRSDDGTYHYVAAEQIQQFQSDAKLRRVQANERRLSRLQQYRAEAMGSNGDTHSKRRVLGEFKGTLTGTRRGLVILVNFSGTTLDLPYEMQTTREDWERAFNEVGYSDNDAVGSVHDYFYDQSYGQFDLEFDVVGPYTVSHEIEYYGKNNSRGEDMRVASMISEACRLANADVNYADYDWDGDGEVDQVYVIYAGYGEATGGADPNTIWPHEFHLSNSQVTMYQPLRLDGVKIDTYACSNELCGTSDVIQNGIGTACHEFSHCIGYPDFYDTDYSGGFGMDCMDIMCSGGHSGPNYRCEVPCGFTSYERWMAGWLDPVVLDGPCFVDGMKDISDAPEAYIIYNEGNRDEYFLLENRQGKRWFSYCGNFQPHHGMLVTHVDYDKESWTWNTPNDDPAHQRMTIIPAGGTYGKYIEQYKTWNITRADYASMTFPGTKLVRSLTNDSHFDCGGKLWNANSDRTFVMNKTITQITENPADGTISFVFMEGETGGLRHTVTLNAGAGTVSTTSMTQSSALERILLPAAQSTAGGVFVGWSATLCNATVECPADLMPAGTAYIPQDDVTLFAVYAYGDNLPAVETYRPATTLVKGRKYVFANKNVATAADASTLSAAGLTTEAFVKSYDATPITFTDGEAIITDPDPACTWIVSSCDEEVVLYNGQHYLDFNSSEGLRLSETPAYLGWDSRYGLYICKEGSSTKYYLRVQSGKFTFSKTGSASARMYPFELDNFSDSHVIYSSTTTSGIGTITAPSTSSATYDLQGRRVTDTMPHGIYIKDGKRVIR